MINRSPEPAPYSAKPTQASAVNTTLKAAQRTARKTVLKVLWLSGLILTTSALTAADADDGSNADSSSNEERAQENASGAPANATGSQKRQAGDKGGVFLPSEDISEDVAITFPVDI